MCIGKKNCRSWSFKQQQSALPEKIQQLAEQAFNLFKTDPAHPSLRSHGLADSNRGRHYLGSVSISITMKYRAIYVETENAILWYWIGSHADYNNFIGKSR